MLTDRQPSSTFLRPPSLYSQAGAPCPPTGANLSSPNLHGSRRRSRPCRARTLAIGSSRSAYDGSAGSSIKAGVTPEKAAAEATRRMHLLQTGDETRKVYGALPWWHLARWIGLAVTWHVERRIRREPGCSATMTNRQDIRYNNPHDRPLLAGRPTWVTLAGGCC